MMPDKDLTLGVVFGLEGPISDNGGRGRETMRQAVQWVREALRGHPALRALDVAPGVVRELGGALGVSLSGIAVSAWNKRKEIAKFGDPQQTPADETHEVWLVEHDIKQVIKPSVVVRLAGQEVGKLTFLFTATFTFDGAMLVIRGGKVTHVRLGDVSASWEFAAELPGGSANLLHKDLGKWSLPGHLKLGDGIPIS
jgi:hypothetical protein